MKPIKKQILVKPFPADEESEGGIFVPLSARKTSNKMLVVDVGNGTKDEPMKLKKGMTVFRVKDWGEEIIINDEKHFILEQSAILSTL